MPRRAQCPPLRKSSWERAPMRVRLGHLNSIGDVGDMENVLGLFELHFLHACTPHSRPHATVISHGRHPWPATCCQIHDVAELPRSHPSHYDISYSDLRSDLLFDFSLDNPPSETLFFRFSDELFVLSMEARLEAPRHLGHLNPYLYKCRHTI